MPHGYARCGPAPYTARMLLLLKTPLRSALALAGALLVLVLVSSMASWLPPLLGLEGGPAAQLGGDLGFSVLAGMAAVAFAARYAPCWHQLHGTALWLLVALGCGWAAWTMGSDFPRWFVQGLLFSLPLQLGAGLWLGTRHLRSATQV